MLLIEIIAIIFSLICVILAVNKNVWSWPIGLIGVVAYAFLFFDVELYADFGLQFIFFAQGVYGWWYWKKGNVGKEISITRFNKFDYMFLIVSFIVLYIFVIYIVKLFNDSNIIFIDAFVAVGSLIANLMLARKKLESWILWIIVDIVYIGLFTYKELCASSVLYFIFWICGVV